VKSLRFVLAGLVAFAVVCLVALLLLGRRTDSRPAEGPAPTVLATSVAQMPESPMAQLAPPTIVVHDSGRLPVVHPPRELPPMVVEPLFEPDARVKIGEPAKLRFAVRDRASGLPESLDDVSASVFHGNDPERKVPVEEVDNGVYEVPFTATGPGQFNIVLSENGTPVGSRKVGVAGVAGTHALDTFDPLSVDPREYRARTGARGRRR
jgi:hypothetical protein